VVVGFPATSIIKSRTRFCVSAAHTDEDILEVSLAPPALSCGIARGIFFPRILCAHGWDALQALQLIDDISDRVMLKYKHSGSFDRDALLKKIM
jgi:hypothetical protein